MDKTVFDLFIYAVQKNKKDTKAAITLKPNP